MTNYTTRAKVSAALITPPADAVIDAVIALVSGYIDTYLGCKLASNYSDTPADFFVDGSGTQHIILDQPLNGFTSVQFIGISGSASDVPYTCSYPLNKPYTTYLGLKTGKFSAGMGNFVFKNARIGYFKVDFVTPANHNLPESITAVATSLAVAMINSGAVVLATSSNELEKSGKITSETIGSYSVSYANNLENASKQISAVPTATDLLAPYKCPNIV